MGEEEARGEGFVQFQRVKPAAGKKGCDYKRVTPFGGGRAVPRSQRVDRDRRMKGFHACCCRGALRTGTVRGPGQTPHRLTRL